MILDQANISTHFNKNSISVYSQNFKLFQTNRNFSTGCAAPLSTARIPIIAMLPALFLNFSAWLLVILVGVIGLLLFRIFIIFPKIACVHCRAKNICPNAKAMGLSSR